MAMNINSSFIGLFVYLGERLPKYFDIDWPFNFPTKVWMVLS